MKIGIYGAGSIGCYLGGRIAAAGHELVFYCRPNNYQKLKSTGLTVSDYKGFEHHFHADQINLTQNIHDVLETDIVFICVKSTATEAVATELLNYSIQAKPILISMQNGVSNVPLLKSLLPEWKILEGMVPFNVAEIDTAHFHQGSEGELMIKDFDFHQILAAKLHDAQLDFEFRSDMVEVQWGKVLLNLNNAINALSGLPLKQQLSNRAYRQCLALVQKEALTILQKAKIKPAQLTVVPARFIPYVLNLPDFLFQIVSKKTLEIDPLARSSMQDDLNAGRLTEIDWINGEVVKLAQSIGLQAPINQLFIDLIHQAENSDLVKIDADELLAKIRSEK